MKNKINPIIIEIVLLAIFITSIIIIRSYIFSVLFFIILLVVGIIAFVEKYIEFKKIQQYEEQFPKFLRDISESIYAGLTMIQAINASKNNDYGTLNKEIEKMMNELSWNIPLERVLRNFSKRMTGSEKIQRSLGILIEAQRHGGDIKSIMTRLAENIEKLRDVELERKALMSQQISMMYMIFMIFVGISITLIKFMTPILSTEGSENAMSILSQSAGGNPCSICIGNNDISCYSCSLLFSVSDSFGFGDNESVGSYYKSLLFMMIIIEGIFSGLVSGQIENDSMLSGLRHSLIMSVIGFVIFIASNMVGFI